MKAASYVLIFLIFFSICRQLPPLYFQSPPTVSRWWRSLEVEEVLGLDYKSFKACTQSCISLRYGMSSILLPLEGKCVCGIREMEGGREGGGGVRGWRIKGITMCIAA